MGPWIPGQATAHCSWQWFICPNTLQLYQYNGHRWNQYNPLHHRRRYVLYDPHPAGTTWQLPPHATPATPYQTPEGNRIILNLPAHPWTDTPADPATAPGMSSDLDSDDDSIAPNPILNQIMDPPTLWEAELWHRITCHSHHDTLNQQLMAGHPIIACSNAAVDNAKYSTFSWIIHSDRALWQGEGIVPGLVEDVYSGHSEAFGILTILQFLEKYVTNYPNTYQTPPQITLYCDSQSVLDRIAQISTKNPVSTRTTIEDDYDVYIAITTAFHAVQPINIRFHHIKGHQDRDKWKKYLSLPARLNIECNKRATEYLPIARNLRPQPNPMIPESHPYLLIAGQTIVTELQTSLWHAANTPDYREYLCKKHK